MKDFAAVYETFVRSTKDNSAAHMGKLKQLTHYTNISDAVCDLYDMIQEKVPVHFSHVMVVVMSMLVKKDEGGRYTPALGEDSRFAKYSRILSEGSMGALFAYQGAGKEINTSISQYLNRDRPQNILDCLLLPN